MMHRILTNSLYLNPNHIRNCFFDLQSLCSYYYICLFLIAGIVFGVEVLRCLDYLMLMVYFSFSSYFFILNY
jgi:hypothetical protein